MSTFWSNFSRGFKNAGSKAAESLVGGVFALPGQFIGQAFDRSAMRFQNEMIRGNMAYQAELNQQAVDRQNEYNSPAAVAARARAAGVDPSVLLGGSPGSPGVSGASTGASLSSPSSRGSFPQDFFSRAFTGQQLKNLESQGNLTDQQAAAAKAAADKDTAEAEHIRQQTDDIRWYNKNVRNLDVLLKKAGLTKAQADARIAELEKLYQEYLSANGDIESSQRFEMFKAELDKIRAEIGDLNASAGLKIEEAEDLDATRASRNRANDASARDNEASAKFKELNNAMFEKYGVSYNSSLSGAIVQGTGKLLEDVSKFLNPGMQNPKGYVELIKSITDHDIQDFNDLLRYLSPSQRTMQDAFLDVCKRFKTVISGKESLVRNSLDISNPMSGIW